MKKIYSLIFLLSIEKASPIGYSEAFMKNLKTQTGPIVDILSTLGLWAGVIFLMMGIWTALVTDDQQTQGSGKFFKGITQFLVGVILIQIKDIIDFLIAT
jgi:formylmethanofuran dehydrogenase subunit D